MTEAPGLIALLSRLPDPRVERSREHELTDLLVSAVRTLLGGAERCDDREDFGHAREGCCGGSRVCPKASSATTP